MKITGIKTQVLETPLRVPFKTAVRRVDSLTDVIVKIETDSEICGFGSAPPTAKVTGDTVGSIKSAVCEIEHALLGNDAEMLEDNLDASEQAIIGNTSAKAAIDIALHDLFCKIINVPLWKYLGGSGRKIETDVTISLNSPEVMVQDAIKGIDAGFKILKIKVGLDTKLDFIRLSELRNAVGSGIKIRIDANQGWSAQEAVHVLDRMQSAGFDIELVEQPVKAHDIKGMAYVTSHSPIPVVADESCWSSIDAIKILSQNAANIINIKLMKCAGIREAKRIIAASQTMGADVMFGSMLEGKISCAAAVAMASAFKCVTKADIDGPILCSHDYINGGPSFCYGPMIELSNDPGLGIHSITKTAVV